MKIFIVVLFTCPFLFQSTVNPTSSLFGNFTGRTPCQEVARAWNLPVQSGCAKLKWWIVFYQDSITHAPTTFSIESTLNRTRTWKGKWTIIRGTKDNPGAVIYHLTPDRPTEFSLSFLKGDDNVLFFIDKEKNLLAGNKDFSYTLNRSEE